MVADRITAITGPTACGKTRLAVELARLTDAEIISADSRQVYRRMDLGTGKDLDEYGDVPVHLIDICEPGTKYNLHQYIRDFHRALDDIRSRGRNVIVCGGTGLYLETALCGIQLPDVDPNPELRARLADKSLDELTEILRGYKTLHNTTDVDTPQRAIRAIEIEEYYRLHPEAARASRRETATPLDARIIALDIPRDLRRRRISERLDARLQADMVDEVRALLAEGIPAENLLYYGLEYKYLTLHILGELTFQEMHDRLEMEIHKFAKRQMTWLRGMERRGLSLEWHPYTTEAAELLPR